MSRLAEFVDRGAQLRGVIHVGANDGAEVEWYLEHGCRPVLCFEPHPGAVERARSRLNGTRDVAYIQCALGDQSGELQMVVPADGDDEKTSRYRPIATPGHPWTEVPAGETIAAPVLRFDDWVQTNAIDLGRFNALVIDAQGMELEVLEGFGAYIQFFDYLCVELSERPVYVGEAAAREVIDYLAVRGFRPESEVCEHDDVLFARPA